MLQSWNRTVSLVQNRNKEDKEQDDERWIFCFLSEKEEQYPTTKEINYYQDEERNTNVGDYPSVHTTLQQSSWE